MQHDGGRLEPATVEIVATWPKGGFAESVAVAADGGVFVSLHTDKAVVRYDPATGAVTPFATFDRPATGLAFAADGTLLVSGGDPGTAPGVVWRVSPAGEVAQLVEIAEAAFLNGVTSLGDRFLIADSLGGKLYALDPEAGGVSTWLADPLLVAPDPAQGPGANGVKVFDGAVTVSVTGADRLVRAPIVDGRPGRVAVLAERLRADDFCFGADGALYIATHPARTLMRLDPDGSRATLAEAAQGMTGATAVAFGRTAADAHSVYVTTTGGTWMLPDAELEAAKLVRVDVGRQGRPLRTAGG